MPTGRKPKDPGTADQRNTKFKWQTAEGEGWQHGDIPAHPDGLKAESVNAWNVWFASWWAAFWTPADLPGLELMVELYDKVRRGDIGPEKLTPYLDRYGVTEKGRQDNRWAPIPAAAPEPVQSDAEDELQRRREERDAQLA